MINEMFCFVFQKPTLSSTPKKKSGFANLKDTIFLKV